MLEGYDYKHASLTETDIIIEILSDTHGIRILHSSEEFGVPAGTHIHSDNIVNGMKTLIEYYLEHLIWKYEEASLVKPIKPDELKEK